MAIFLLDTWVPVKGKQKENEDVVKKVLQYGTKHPDISKYVKSLRYFKHSIGGKPPGKTSSDNGVRQFIRARMLVPKFVRRATCASVLRLRHIWIIW